MLRCIMYYVKLKVVTILKLSQYFVTLAKLKNSQAMTTPSLYYTMYYHSLCKTQGFDNTERLSPYLVTLEKLLQAVTPLLLVLVKSKLIDTQ